MAVASTVSSMNASSRINESSLIQVTVVPARMHWFFFLHRATRFGSRGDTDRDETLQSSGRAGLPMEPGIFTKIFPRPDFAGVFDAVRDHGLRQVQLIMRPDGDEALLDEIPGSLIDEIRAESDRTGVRISPPFPGSTIWRIRTRLFARPGWSGCGR